MKISYLKSIRAFASLVLLPMVMPLAQAEYSNEKRLTFPDGSYFPSFVGDASINNSPQKISLEVTEMLSKNYHPLAVMFYADQRGISHQQFFDIADDLGLNTESLQDAYQNDGLKEFMSGGLCSSAMTSSNDLEKFNPIEVQDLSESDLNISPIDAVANDFFNKGNILVASVSNEYEPEAVDLHSDGLLGGVGTINVSSAQLKTFINNGGISNVDIGLVDRAKPSSAGDYSTGVESWYADSSPTAGSADISSNPPIRVLMKKGQGSEPNKVLLSEAQRGRLQAYVGSELSSIPVVFYYDGSNFKTTNEMFGGRNLKASDQIKVIQSQFYNEKNRLVAVPNTLNNQGQFTIGYQFIDSNIAELPIVSEMSSTARSSATIRANKSVSWQFMMVNQMVYVGDIDAIAVQQSQGKAPPYSSMSYKEIEIDAENASSECLQVFEAFQNRASLQALTIGDDAVNLSDSNDANNGQPNQATPSGPQPPNPNKPDLPPSSGGVGVPIPPPAPPPAPPSPVPPGPVPPGPVPPGPVPPVTPGVLNEISPAA